MRMIDGVRMWIIEGVRMWMIDGVQMWMKYLRLHHLQYRFLTISGGGPPDPPSEARLVLLGGPPFGPSKLSLWVDMYAYGI